jgi:AraC-like DNA-binding protein
MSEGEGHRARVGNQSYRIFPGEAIFTPQQIPSVEVETGNYIGVAFSLSDACLRKAFRSLNPEDSHNDARLDMCFARPILFSPVDPLSKILLEQFKALIALIDWSVDSNGQLGASLRLDDLFAARLATLLCQSSRRHDSLCDYEVADGRADPCFDDLIDYIRENLRNPLGLSDLSERSGLSRHQLRQAFQHHFGLSPMRWIHGQRIQVLNQMLEG